MSNESSSREVAKLSHRSTLVAVVGGVLGLLLFAALGIGLPKVVGDGSTGSDETSSGDGGAASSADELVLPDETGSWASMTSLLEGEADVAAQEQYAAGWAYADSTLVETAGVPADAERYYQPGSNSVIAIQAYRGPDGPLVPATLADPSSGEARILLQNYGDVECVLDVISGDVSPTPQVQEMQCRRTSADLTIRAFVLDGASGEAVAELIDNLWSDLS